MLHWVFERIKDIVFPYFCAGCGREGEWWCKSCRQNHLKISTRAEGELNSLTALFKYHEENCVEGLIKEFKYSFTREIEKLWREVIIESGFLPTKDSVVMAVPLFPRRERERGYNQAEIIAKIISEESGCRLVSNRLKRVRQTDQQAKLGLEQRVKNVSGAFVYNSNVNFDSVLLVDDVFTTGATMNECARALRKSGVKEVSGFVLARG